MRPVEILSCVGGGPMARLAEAMGEMGRQAKVREAFSPERWRAMMAAGPLGRGRARFGATALFPLQALASAAIGPKRTLVATTNPFFLPVLLVAFRRLHRKRVVALIYDLYPDALEVDRGAQAARGLGRIGAMLNRYLFSNADGVVFIGPGMAEHARARYGDPNRWTVLETGASCAEFDRGASSASLPVRIQAWAEGKFVVAYVGNMGRMHDWKTLADAGKRLIRDEKSNNIAFLVAATGPGAERLREAWAHLPADRVRFEAPLDDASWAATLCRADVSVATLRDEAANTSIPSKLFSAMAARCAILAIAPAESDLARVVTATGCGEVVPPGAPQDVSELLARWASDPVQVGKLAAAARSAASNRFDLPVLARQWLRFVDEPIAAVRGGKLSNETLKRALDVGASAAALLVASPLLGALSVAVALDIGRPVFFRQERLGLNGQVFRLWKFRTMRAPRPGEEGPEADAARITRLGGLLRSLSLDELPSLLNVLLGDMSLVGPRPLLTRYKERYSSRQSRRHETKPGITGWAQINGRNAIDWDTRLELDVWYVENRRLALDLEILARTAMKVVRREGIAQEGHATMPEFMGPAAERTPGKEVSR